MAVRRESFVSRFAAPQVRFLCRPEVTLITLVPRRSP